MAKVSCPVEVLPVGGRVTSAPWSAVSVPETQTKQLPGLQSRTQTSAILQRPRGQEKSCQHRKLKLHELWRLAWFAGHTADTLFLAAVSAAELRTGATILPDGQRRDRLVGAIDPMIDQDFAGHMHHTFVPNILKVLNPPSLYDLRAQIEEVGDNTRKLLNLRARIAKIRVFDRACGSGIFLVIACKEMRSIEAAINQRRGEAGRKADVTNPNFCGIERRDFAAEIARPALIIAKFQCDVTYRGAVQAWAEFLP